MSGSDVLGPPPGDQAVPSHSTLFDDPEDSPPVVSPRVSATDRGRLYRSAGATGSLASLATPALAKPPAIDPALPDSPEAVAAEAAAQQAAQAAAAEAAAQAAAKQAAAEEAAAAAVAAQADALAAAEAARLAAQQAAAAAEPPAPPAEPIAVVVETPAEVAADAAAEPVAEPPTHEAVDAASAPAADAPVEPVVEAAAEAEPAEAEPAEAAPVVAEPAPEAPIGLAPLIPVPLTPATPTPAPADPLAGASAAAAVIAANTEAPQMPAVAQATPLLPPPDASPTPTSTEMFEPVAYIPAPGLASRQTLSWTRGTLIIMGVTVLAAAVDVLWRHGIGSLTGIALIISSVVVAFLLRREDIWAAVIAPPLSFLVALVTVGQFAVAAGSGGGVAKWFSRQALNIVTGLSLNAPWILAATLLALAVVLFRRFREPREQVLDESAPTPV